MKLLLSFHYQRCVPVSNIVKTTAFFTLTTKSIERFQAKLENATGVLFTAYFSKDAPLVFSGDLCRTEKPGDWVVLWVIGDRPLEDSASPYEVKLVGSAEAPPGVRVHMIEPTATRNELLDIQESAEPEKENAELATDPVEPVGMPQDSPGKIDASAPPTQTRAPSLIPSFKAFRNFLSS